MSKQEVGNSVDKINIARINCPFKFFRQITSVCMRLSEDRKNIRQFMTESVNTTSMQNLH